MNVITLESQLTIVFLKTKNKPHIKIGDTMSLKLVSYFKENCSQVFATFEYEDIQFDMYKDLKTNQSSWEFMKDEGFDRLNKVADVNEIEMNCFNYLNLFDKELFLY